jgi:hypothetical protein
VTGSYVTHRTATCAAGCIYDTSSATCAAGCIYDISRRAKPSIIPLARRVLQAASMIHHDVRNRLWAIPTSPSVLCHSCHSRRHRAFSDRPSPSVLCHSCHSISAMSLMSLNQCYVTHVTPSPTGCTSRAKPTLGNVTHVTQGGIGPSPTGRTSRAKPTLIGGTRRHE